LAVLSGEEMMRFRAGRNLFTYCGDCANSALTPITHLLGCTQGDNPAVLDYSDRISKSKTDPAVEKCPGFTSKAIADGDAALREASRRAMMVKEVPLELFDDMVLADPKTAGVAGPISDPDEIGELFDYLDELAIDQADPNETFGLVLHALTTWRDGLMAQNVTRELVRDTIAAYREARGI
jgi:hypothetical protein